MEDYLSSGSTLLQTGRVCTAGRFALPGERPGPGEGLGEDQRWGRLAPITLIFHPLRETNG